MADPVPSPPEKATDQAPPIDPYVLSDAATPTPAAPDLISPPPTADDDDAPPIPSPESPLNDPARAIQLEFEEQEDEGKV